jgi:DUF4097 and DUF4098 domain-containing protein YvlB
MRRGSIIGPMILIFIGFVFLMRNIRPDVPLMEWLETYWPFLLIVWGVVRLVEVTYWHFSSRPMPERGVAGGEWALIIVLTLVGTAVWGTERLVRDHFGRFQIGSVEMFGESFDYDVAESNTEAGKTPHVVIDNSRGGVRVTGADGTIVKVAGRKSVRAIDRPSADRANSGSHCTVEKSGDTITVTSRSSGIQDSARVTVDLDVTVPKGASVELRGQNGDLDIGDLTGEVSVYSDNAGVRAQNLAGKLKVETRKSDIIRATGVRGDIELKGRGRDIELEDIQGQVSINGSYSGETRLRNISKPIRFESSVTQLRLERVPGELQLGLSTLSGTNLVGPLVVKTTKPKDVRLSDVTDSVSIDVEEGDVEVTQTKLPMPRVDVRVRSGSVELALPTSAKCNLNASTSHGEVNNDFDDRLKQTTEGQGAKLAGSLGGTTEVKLSTDRGGITVRKSGPGMVEPPAPPAAPSPKALKAPNAPKAPIAPPEKVTN